MKVEENPKQQVSEWYRSYSDDIYQYVFFMIKDHNEALDLVHDTFLRSYHNYHSFQGGNVRGWLFRIARNVAIDFIRKKKPIAYVMDSTFPFMPKTVSAEHDATLKETTKELYYAIQKLKSSYRDVIVLRKMEGFSIAETAEILGWKEGKVRTTLTRATKALEMEWNKRGFSHETFK